MSGVPIRVMLELREDVAARALLLALGAAIDELVVTKAFDPSDALKVFNKHQIDIVRQPPK
ncbi:hypothetical protein [uncultured Bradyrhizobium sp.]|uniref:hypothetical protein n=1 Tax=uncultured Bradyrhizobium sp. TaxID=199684 RepID=UPI00262BC746|nr:hypothetical protein [uncultured Bradyrhizobium sp.]